MRNGVDFGCHCDRSRYRYLPTCSVSVTVTARVPIPRTVPVTATRHRSDVAFQVVDTSLISGSASIAIDDPLLDPFVNPAKGSRMRESLFYGAPVYYSVSNGDGSGRTLPVGALFASRTWFGGVQLSLQQIDFAERGPFAIPEWPIPVGGFERLRDRAANNMYAFGLLGRRIPGTRMSVGASVFYADLEALDGVDLLYTLSESVEQSGQVADVRAGLTGELEGGSTFEAVLLHHRLDMTHEIVNVIWPCCIDWPQPWGPVRQEETNYDRTNTWGVHLGYRRPVGRRGWNAGGIVTANRKTHPRIPNYEIMNIPRDPGDSWAWKLGFGLARERGPTAFAIDLIWEPIWSETWAEADTLLQSPLGHQIRPGEKTVENDFRFSNATLRTDSFTRRPVGVQVWASKSDRTASISNRRTTSCAPTAISTRAGWNGLPRGVHRFASRTSSFATTVVSPPAVAGPALRGRRSVPSNSIR